MTFWDKFFDVYIEDSFWTYVPIYFLERRKPAKIMREITAVMLETSRKGMWQASPEQIAKLAQRHSELTIKYGASGLSDNNTKSVRVH